MFLFLWFPHSIAVFTGILVMIPFVHVFDLPACSAFRCCRYEVNWPFRPVISFSFIRIWPPFSTWNLIHTASHLRSVKSATILRIRWSSSDLAMRKILFGKKMFYHNNPVLHILANECHQCVKALADVYNIKPHQIASNSSCAIKNLFWSYFTTMMFNVN